MLATLLQRWKVQHRPAPIISVSEISCFGCRLYFIVHRKARFQLRGVELPRHFTVTGAHNTLYVPWVSPDLRSIDPILHAGVQQQLLMLVQDVSRVHVKGRRQYPKITAFLQEDGEVMEVLPFKDILRDGRAKRP
ncbi:uncharacterized protein BT62DRAFT_997114 [Guyanagaster necrorhizus]|uniref:Uncharacterized protein n=1 Tax=Guyanagaster necrorhizus TaxID=856835 RepID=A0A9P7VJ43_9AGAR|nr:uncharacterized protein BT62DRAFT_997114 [Guyanagaster necrorhizus MCA 3950]KAG7441475.1 hypothetical protein BT62DRAFT_997114 [Guyanagaster necrorhizus MCA 3950]